MNFAEWMKLYKVAQARFRSNADYANFQAFQAEMILKELAKRGIYLENKQILDLGCGHGGYSFALAQKSNRVIALDRYIVQKNSPLGNIGWLRGDALMTPFRDNQFEFIMCASLIEHVREPIGLLKEIRRVLSPSGLCYLSFPPFYSPVGGHQFKPWHLLGEKLAIRLSGHADAYESAFGQWGLYRRTIRGVKRHIRDSGLKIQSTSTRYFPINFAALPFVGEFLTWHVQFILTKSVTQS